MDRDYFEKHYLWPQLKTWPYFRALLRAVEASYYADLELPTPVYDLGCGDGSFAPLAFDKKLDVGLDPWFPIYDAAKENAYKGLVLANGNAAPLPNAHFSSAVSNSVLEHVAADELDGVLADTARILKPGAPFYFCVPNHRWTESLHISGVLRKLGLKRLATGYENLFIRISRHVHMHNPEEWEARLNKAGFDLVRTWHYFPPASLHWLEWGHYFGLPSVIAKRLFGRWILAPTRWNLALTKWLVGRHSRPEEISHGTYSFYIAKRR